MVCKEACDILHPHGEQVCERSLAGIEELRIDYIARIQLGIMGSAL